MRRTPTLGKSLMGVRFILFVCATSLFTLPALSQNQNVDITNQISRMQRDLQLLSRQIYKGNTGNGALSVNTNSRSQSAANNAYISRIEDRLDQLEGETRANTGSVESTVYKLNQISARLESIANDINFRLTTIEERLNSVLRNPPVSATSRLPSEGSLTGGTRPTRMAKVPRASGVEQVGPTSGGSTLGNQPRTLGVISQKDLNLVRQNGNLETLKQNDLASPSNFSSTVGQQTAISSKKILPKGTPEEQYKYAFSLVRKDELALASEALEEFIESYPGKPLASNARYWLGRTYYVRKEYRRAAEIFLVAYQSQPKGKRAADNLLRLGMSLAELGNKKDACTTFDKVERDFLDLNSIVKKQVVQRRKKIGCD